MGRKPGTFFSNECKRKLSISRRKRVGINSPSWKGGRKIDSQGYVQILNLEHPNSIYGYVLGHILIMERHLGRILNPSEVVHHINGNRIENLELTNQSIHARNHRLEDKK